MHLLHGLHRLVLWPIEKPLGIQLHGCKTENKTGCTFRTAISKMKILTSSSSKLWGGIVSVCFASFRFTIKS